MVVSLTFGVHYILAPLASLGISLMVQFHLVLISMAVPMPGLLLLIPVPLSLALLTLSLVWTLMLFPVLPFSSLSNVRLLVREPRSVLGSNGLWMVNSQLVIFSVLRRKILPIVGLQL